MSFQCMSWAVEQQLPAMAKLVLLMLANHSNTHSGRCDPSLVLLAEECGMSKDSVIRQIKALEVQGLVRVIRRRYGTTSLRNAYLLMMPGVKISPQFELAEVATELEEGGGTDGGGSSSQLPLVVADSDQGSRSQRQEPRSNQELNQLIPPDDPRGLATKSKNSVLNVTAKNIIERYPTVTEQIAKDYLTLRKAKKAPLTQTAWKAICGVLDILATQHATDPADALAVAITKGWQGLKVEWVLNELQAVGGGNDEQQYFRQAGRGGNRDSQQRLGASGRVSAAVAAERAKLTAPRSVNDPQPLGQHGQDVRPEVGKLIRN